MGSAKLQQLQQATSTLANLILLSNCLLAMAVSLGSCSHQEFGSNRFSRNLPALTRRSAGDDDLRRPMTRLEVAASQEAPTIVMGKFKAPSPDKIFKHRLPKSSNFGQQTMSASFQVMDDNNSEDGKIVNGVIGAGSALNKRTAQQQQQQPREHKVSAKMQVSDEGLNYPPSKLSADIYGNVAEIVTAPPEAVDNEFLVPQLSQMYGNRRP